MYRTISGNIFIKILITVVISILLSSCAQDNVKQTESSHRQNQSQAAAKKPTKLTRAEREHYRKGITALYKNDFAAAQRIFSEFIRNKPELAGPYTNLALLHFKKNELDKAFKFVNQALERNPRQSQAYNLRAQIYVSRGKIHKAKDDYLKAVQLKPDYSNAQYNLALLYDIYLQEIELAIKHYEIYMSLLKKPDEKTLEWINHLKGTLKDASANS